MPDPTMIQPDAAHRNPADAPRARAHGTPHLVVDDFLPAGVADRLLEQMLAAEERFAPARLQRGVVAPDIRSALRLPGRIGVDLAPFLAAIDARADALCDAVGVTPFPVHHRECSIIAYRDGDFYRRHVDTGPARKGDVRVVSCVYYLHRRPRGFEAGELVLHSLLGRGPTQRIAPVHNRLAVFPSFTPHEVEPTRSTGGFADARFSINCWLRRQVRPGE